MQSDTQPQRIKINSSIVSKSAMNSFDEMFPLGRMFPLAVIHTLSNLKLWKV